MFSPALQVPSLGILAVGEHQQPPLLLGFIEDVPLLLQGVLRGIIEGRDHSKVQVVMSRDEVAKKNYSFTTVGEHHHLVPFGMSVGYYDVKSRENLLVAVQELQLTSLLDRHEVFFPVGAKASLIGMDGVLPAGPLDVIGGFGERGH